MKKQIRKVLPKPIARAAEEVYRKSRVRSLQRSYGNPSEGLKIIAVTGTNGKTTTSNYINNILKTAGLKTAMHTSTVIEMDGEASINTTHRTVPLTANLMKFFQKCHELKVDYVVLETTSQGLHQHKLDGIKLEAAVFTNLTPEHLDYHKTMEAYAKAKMIMFGERMMPKYCVLNRDDSYYDQFAKASVGEVTSYGSSDKATHKIMNLKQGMKATKWTLDSNGQSMNLDISQVGEFNAYNASAAALAALTLGISADAIKKGLKTTHTVPGRMEILAGTGGEKPLVLIDYAHTPDAVEKVLEAANKLKQKRLICITGAAGERSLSRRAPVGKIAANSSDVLYVTDDEPYSEDPDKIRSQVMAGVNEAENKSVVIEIPDRCEAFKAAFKNAKKGDVIVIAGMGRQTTRCSMKGDEPWDDYEVALDVMNGNPSKYCDNWHTLYPVKR